MYGIIIAFQRYQPHLGFLKSPWVGLAHFRSFFENPLALRTLKNTLIISVYNLIFVFPAPIILALLLNEIKRYKIKRVIQTVTYLPYFISTVVIVGIMANILSPDMGVINQIIKMLGGQEIHFMAEPKLFRSLYIGSDIWQGVGWGAIIYIAALAGISIEQYEAAIVDGANRFQQMRYITLPGISPTIIILLLLRIGNFLQIGFERILLMQNPFNMDVSDVISTHVYTRGLTGGAFSYATAIDLMNNLIGFILLISANYVARKISEFSLW